MKLSTIQHGKEWLKYISNGTNQKSILMQLDCYGTTNKLKKLNDDKINYFLASGASAVAQW